MHKNGICQSLQDHLGVLGLLHNEGDFFTNINDVMVSGQMIAYLNYIDDQNNLKITQYALKYNV